MVYELSATMFTVLAYVVLTWTAIMALFIVGTTFWQMKRAFGPPQAEPVSVQGGDD